MYVSSDPMIEVYICPGVNNYVCIIKPIMSMKFLYFDILPWKSVLTREQSVGDLKYFKKTKSGKDPTVNDGS